METTGWLLAAVIQLAILLAGACMLLVCFIRFQAKRIDDYRNEINDLLEEIDELSDATTEPEAEQSTPAPQTGELKQRVNDARFHLEGMSIDSADFNLGDLDPETQLSAIRFQVLEAELRGNTADDDHSARWKIIEPTLQSIQKTLTAGSTTSADDDSIDEAAILDNAEEAGIVEGAPQDTLRRMENLQDLWRTNAANARITLEKLLKRLPDNAGRELLMDIREQFVSLGHALEDENAEQVIDTITLTSFNAEPETIPTADEAKEEEPKPTNIEITRLRDIAFEQNQLIGNLKTQLSSLSDLDEIEQYLAEFDEMEKILNASEQAIADLERDLAFYMSENRRLAKELTEAGPDEISSERVQTIVSQFSNDSEAMLNRIRALERFSSQAGTLPEHYTSYEPKALEDSGTNNLESSDSDNVTDDQSDSDHAQLETQQDVIDSESSVSNDLGGDAINVDEILGAEPEPDNTSNENGHAEESVESPEDTSLDEIDEIDDILDQAMPALDGLDIADVEAEVDDGPHLPLSTDETAAMAGAIDDAGLNSDDTPNDEPHNQNAEDNVDDTPLNTDDIDALLADIDPKALPKDSTETDESDTLDINELLEESNVLDQSTETPISTIDALDTLDDIDELINDYDDTDTSSPERSDDDFDLDDLLQQAQAVNGETSSSTDNPQKQRPDGAI